MMLKKQERKNVTNTKDIKRKTFNNHHPCHFCKLPISKHIRGIPIIYKPFAGNPEKLISHPACLLSHINTVEVWLKKC